MPYSQPASQQQYRYSLQPGESLSVVTDAVSSCRYGQLPGAPSSPDVPAGGMIAVAASSTVTLGPRSDFSRWLIDLLVGPGRGGENEGAKPWLTIK